MDLGIALTFQFKDPQWPRKLILAAALILIPVIGWLFVFGWSLAVARQVIRGEGPALPELDLAEDLIRGIKGFLISLGYSLPALVVVIPLAIVLGFISLASNDSSQTLGTMTFFTMLLCLMAGSFLYVIVYALVIPAAYANFLSTGESISEGFRISKVWGLVKKAPVAYFLVLVGQFICGFISFFGLAACLVGILFTSAYTLTVMGHLYGQAFREAIK